MLWMFPLIVKGNETKGLFLKRLISFYYRNMNTFLKHLSSYPKGHIWQARHHVKDMLALLVCSGDYSYMSQIKQAQNEWKMGFKHALYLLDSMQLHVWRLCMRFRGIIDWTSWSQNLNKTIPPKLLNQADQTHTVSVLL